MIIVGLSGGLGNQMFQYALYRKFKNLGKDVKLDLSSYQAKNSIREYGLDIFRIQADIATVEDRKRVGMDDSLLARLRRKMGRSNARIYRENLDLGYQPCIFDLKDMYLDGYWQSEKYFRDIRKEMLGSYRFDDQIRQGCREILAEIENTESVSVHIRRGDYLTEQNTRIYGGICTLEYYKKAMEYVRRRRKAPVFFLFSNDMEWVRQNLFGPGMVLVDRGIGRDDHYDMYLMTRCKSNIIANSSFSWWGAWLNEYTDKIVVAPKKWFSNHEVNDVVCDSWVKIKG